MIWADNDLATIGDSPVHDISGEVKSIDLNKSIIHNWPSDLTILLVICMYYLVG
jgi:hypothetical protein